MAENDQREMIKSATGTVGLAARLKKGWVVSLTVIAAWVLVSCATSSDPISTPTAVEIGAPATTLTLPDTSTETATAGSTDAGTATPNSSGDDYPAAPAENTVVRVGIIESVVGDTMSIETLDGAISVHLTGDSIIQEFGDRSPKDLAIGQRVTVMGQDTEAGIAARAIIVSLENTSLYQDKGDFQMGRARALVGTITSIDDGSITVSTKLGPRTATITLGETAFKMPAQSSREQLFPGQLVTVIGTESPEGGIAARSVLITPDLRGLMAAGRRGGRAGGAGGRGPGSAPSSETATVAGPTPTFDAERQAGTYQGITFVVTEGSEATFRVREQLALIPLPHRAEMRTTALSGEIHLDGRPSVVEIELHQLSSNQSLRDRYVRRSMFPDHPKATFTLEDVGALPSGLAEGEEVKAQIAGVLNIRGADFPLVFDITAQDRGDSISIRGRTKFTWDDLGINRPAVSVVLKLGDEVEVRIALTVKPVR